MIYPEAQTESERGVEGCHELGNDCGPGTASRFRRKEVPDQSERLAYLPAALALAASHLAWVISTKPWPLQEF